MSQDFLPQFRQQLATWTEKYLAEQRLPFQRIEISPSVLTDKGHHQPDIVLWINRDSQLAGSMLLLPAKVDQQFLENAVAMCMALGLGNFVTWGARDVCIWQVINASAEKIQGFTLPPAHQVQPQDFESTLEQLLMELKVISVKTAPITGALSDHYFINLCLRCLQELSPGLTDSARLIAGPAADDEWVVQAPLEKAWMSLWRALFLLWQKRLPPGLQPDRMEQVFHYALADFKDDFEYIEWLQISAEESPLSENAAVRLNHLTGRLSQLGWPKSETQAVNLVDMLLNEVADQLSLSHQGLPWSTDDTGLWINAQPDNLESPLTLIAPRAYLAGVSLLSLLTDSKSLVLTTRLQDLPVPLQQKEVFACLGSLQKASRKTHDEHLLLLRKSWPNRRFELPNKTPVWLFYALYLAGTGAERLTMTLPAGWQQAPGIHLLWETLFSRFQLLAITRLPHGEESLCFQKIADELPATRVFRDEAAFEVNPNDFSSTPASTLYWLHAHTDVIRYLQGQSFTSHDTDWSDEKQWGAYLYLQTRLGRYIWGICSSNAALPQYQGVAKAVASFGVPLPEERKLLTLSLSGSRITRELPSGDLLEREFSGIFGEYPPPPEHHPAQRPDASRAQRKSPSLIGQIVEKVFLDGIPAFPEHYLMDFYRPELLSFEIDGPLTYVEEFFDKVILQSSNGTILEVSGKTHAEALILASLTGKESVELPADPMIMDSILGKYRVDLKKLWKALTSECRLVDPRQHAALKLAKKLWQKQGLPPESLL